MKALVYHGPRKVSVDTVPDAKIERYTDDKLAKKGEIAFDMGKFWFKGQKMGTGQCNGKAYNRHLRDLIHHDRANPSIIISHELPLEDAPDEYKHIDDRDNGWTKVVLHPNADKKAA